MIQQQQETILTSIEDLEFEYMPNYTIWDVDNKRIGDIKRIVFEDLTQTERTILLLYSNNHSQRKVADILGVSSFTVNGIIKRIREKIIIELKKREERRCF